MSRNSLGALGTAALAVAVWQLLAASLFARGLYVAYYVLDEQGKLTAQMPNDKRSVWDCEAKLYYRWDGGKITAMKAPGGAAAWETPLAASSQTPFREIPGVLVAAVGPGPGIVGLEKSTGKILYRYERKGCREAGYAWWYAHRGTLYLLDEDIGTANHGARRPSQIVALDLRTGRESWRCAVDPPNKQPIRNLWPGMAETFVFDPATGKPLPALSTGSIRSAWGTGQCLYQVSPENGGRLIAYCPATGKPLWSIAPLKANTFLSGYAAGGEEHLEPSVGDYLFCYLFSPSEAGDEITVVDTKTHSAARLPIPTGSRLLQGTKLLLIEPPAPARREESAHGTQFVFGPPQTDAYSLATGKRLWSRKNLAPVQVFPSPWVASQQGLGRPATVFLQERGNVLCAVAQSDGTTRWQWKAPEQEMGDAAWFTVEPYGAGWLVGRHWQFD
jgi:outer membrane protein assembly factor BamB